MVSIFHKVHGSGASEVLAVCDKELCGKTLEEGNIEFKVYESFYKGEEISSKALKEMIHEFGSVNLVGNKAVAIALEEKLVSEENVLEIAGVKHVQIFKI